MCKGVGGLLAAAIFFLASASVSIAQMDSPEALNRRESAAYTSKDFPTFLVLAKQILTISPADPRGIYNVACGEALTGHAAEAVSQLGKLIHLRVDFGADKDPDFTGILKTPEWKRYEAELTAMRKPLVRSTVAFTLPEKGLLASSIAVDERNGDTYIGSLRERKIIKRTKDGVVSDFATERDGLMGVSSLLLDPVRHYLLAGVCGVPFMQGFTKEDDGKAAILVFDLDTRKLLRNAPIAVPGEHHLFMQMAADKSGNVFAVDSASSEIWRLRRSSTELELYVSSVVFHAPRGLALSEDQRTLYVMDLPTGLWALDVLSIDRRHIEVPEGTWVGGMVGLARTSDGFISLQTGLQPIQLVNIHLDAKGEKVAAVEALESNRGEYEGPMPGVLAGSDLFYLANSQLDLVDPKTNLLALHNAVGTVVLRLSIAK